MNDEAPDWARCPLPEGRGACAGLSGEEHGGLWNWKDFLGRGFLSFILGRGRRAIRS